MNSPSLGPGQFPLHLIPSLSHFPTFYLLVFLLFHFPFLTRYIYLPRRRFHSQTIASRRKALSRTYASGARCMGCRGVSS